MLRSIAEQRNIIQRMKLDIDKAKNFSMSAFAKDMLEVSDNLKRTLSAIDIEEIRMKEKIETEHVVKI